MCIGLLVGSGSRPSRRTRRNQRGFTVLEVLVAFAIATSTLAVVFSLLARNAASTREASQYVQAILIGESILHDSSTEATSGSFRPYGADGPMFSWERTPTPYTADIKSSIQLEGVKVTVSWAGKHATKSVQLSTLRPVKGGTP